MQKVSWLLFGKLTFSPRLSESVKLFSPQHRLTLSFRSLDTLTDLQGFRLLVHEMILIVVTIQEAVVLKM